MFLSCLICSEGHVGSQPIAPGTTICASVCLEQGMGQAFRVAFQGYKNVHRSLGPIGQMWKTHRMPMEEPNAGEHRLRYGVSFLDILEINTMTTLIILNPRPSDRQCSCSGWGAASRPHCPFLDGATHCDAPTRAGERLLWARPKYVCQSASDARHVQTREEM